MRKREDSHRVRQSSKPLWCKRRHPVASIRDKTVNYVLPRIVWPPSFRKPRRTCRDRIHRRSSPSISELTER